MTKVHLTKKVLEIARSEFKGVEFTAKDMLEELKKVWKFKLNAMRVWHILKELSEDDQLAGRKKYIEKWAWSSTSYVWLWRLV